MLNCSSAIALQKEKLRQAAGPTGRFRGDSRHGTQRLIAALLIHRLFNTMARLRNMSSGLIRGTSWGQTR